MSTDGKPLVAITMGDPAGIGPEVTAKALLNQSVYEKCRPFVIGSAAAIEYALQLIGAGASTHVAHSVGEVRGENGALDVLDLENLDYEYEYWDNFRFARKHNSDEEFTYYAARNNGCCGAYDQTFLYLGEEILIGFNYGH